MIYLDNAATTMVCPEAAAAAVRMMTERYGNPSSTHSMGRQAKAALDTARDEVAAALGASPEEISFTSCGTEADDWALWGACRQMRHIGKHVITSLTEHDAIRRSADRLEREGFEVTRLEPGPDGAVRLEDVLRSVRPDTVLVSLMLVNNETGAITPIRELSAALKDCNTKALLHTDAVQAFGKLPFSAKTLGADLITVSGHKIHAPKGVGALYIRSGLHLPPLIEGGGQERGLRSGTEALPAIAAFGEAARIVRLRADEIYSHFQSIRALAETCILQKLPDAVFIGEGGAPHILNVSLPGYRSEVLLNYLDAKGICVSKGSACKRGARSHVLEAMKLPPKVIDGAIRVSFSRFSTAEEVREFAETLAAAAAAIRKSVR